ncbi:MAG: hypothetical protein WA071_19685 [Undibacterium umbellatum]|uniref:hypothetical protein n=1 Tax=Undibacterium umbellatum TaxID=2762300 RepID=UPI003BB7BAB4
MQDQKTPNRQYNLPHIQNPGAQEVDRLRDTFTAIDADINTLAVVQAGKADKTTTANLQAQIDDLTTLIYAGLI